MKRLIALACFGFVFAASAPVFAGAQQNKMKGCSAEAKGMKGAERKAFMSKCLKKDYVLKSEAAPAAAEKKAAKPDPKPAASAAAPAKTAAVQQDKMKNCSVEAKTKGLKGAERRTFMSSCLKS
jgi:psiF repeat